MIEYILEEFEIGSGCMEEIKIIDPQNLHFAYGFTKDECYKELTGICSLKEAFDQNEGKRITKKNRADKKYCQRLYIALSKKKVDISDILIHKMRCGHYDFTNGRHRVCISQQKKLNILVEMTNEDLLCLDCEDKNENNQLGLDEDYTIIE